MIRHVPSEKFGLISQIEAEQVHTVLYHLDEMMAEAEEQRRKWSPNESITDNYAKTNGCRYLSEASLLECLKQNDLQAFNYLYSQYKNFFVKSLMYRFPGFNRLEIEDVCHQVIVLFNYCYRRKIRLTCKLSQLPVLNRVPFMCSLLSEILQAVCV